MAEREPQDLVLRNPFEVELPENTLSENNKRYVAARVHWLATMIASGQWSKVGKAHRQYLCQEWHLSPSHLSNIINMASVSLDITTNHAAKLRAVSLSQLHQIASSTDSELVAIKARDVILDDLRKVQSPEGDIKNRNAARARAITCLAYPNETWAEIITEAVRKPDSRLLAVVQAAAGIMIVHGEESDETGLPV